MRRKVSAKLFTVLLSFSGVFVPKNPPAAEDSNGPSAALKANVFRKLISIP
jgi:hypothetical protein